MRVRKTLRMRRVRRIKTNMEVSHPYFVIHIMTNRRIMTQMKRQ